MATGFASAYLCVLAVTVLFERPDGRGLLSDPVGLMLAGLISIGGLWIARRWDSQWLGVLAVLGSPELRNERHAAVNRRTSHRVAAMERRCERALRPGCTALASSRAPTSRSGARCCR
jgi:hypothetical protein